MKIEHIKKNRNEIEKPSAHTGGFGVFKPYSKV